MPGVRLIAVLVLTALASAAQASPRPRWTTFADCAGAYMANARVADAERPASMVNQMSGVAEDYAQAARKAYRREKQAGASRARAVVGQRIDATARRLSQQPREAAEKVIDACPQTDG